MMCFNVQVNGSVAPFSVGGSLPLVKQMQREGFDLQVTDARVRVGRICKRCRCHLGSGHALQAPLGSTDYALGRPSHLGICNIVPLVCLPNHSGRRRVHRQNRFCLLVTEGSESAAV